MHDFICAMKGWCVPSPWMWKRNAPALCTSNGGARTTRSEWRTLAKGSTAPLCNVRQGAGQLHTLGSVTPKLVHVGGLQQDRTGECSTPCPGQGRQEIPGCCRAPPNARLYSGPFAGDSRAHLDAGVCAGRCAPSFNHAHCSCPPGNDLGGLSQFCTHPRGTPALAAGRSSASIKVKHISCPALCAPVVARMRMHLVCVLTTC